MPQPEIGPTVTFFVNGEGMRGGRLNEGLASARFLGDVRTAPHYRFYSVRDEFPGLYPVADGQGHSIPGEAYEVDYETLRSVFLPREPAELQLGVIELEDSRGSLSMVLRGEHLEDEGVSDISEQGGWRAYRGQARES
jgi:gamma-glutamylcyclotransferase (GGCT)/AIG2-like uncharacterized protein YtfP